MARIYLIILSCILLPFLGSGQDACFYAEDTVGCAPFTIKLVDCSGSGSSQLAFYFYEDGPSFTTSTSHTYDQPGYYTISQSISVGGKFTDTLEKVVRIVSNTVPEFEVQACENKLAHVAVNEDYYDFYEINWNDGTPLDSILPFENLTHAYSEIGLKNITVTGRYHAAECFQSNEKTVTIIEQLTTPLLSELNVTDQSSNGELSLHVSLDSAQNYRVMNNLLNSRDTITSFISTLQDSTFSFSGLDNTSSSCFTLETFDRCGNTYFGDTLCSLILSAEAMNNSNTLVWANSPITNLGYLIVKNSQDTINLSENNYSDTDINCGVSYCYTVTSRQTSRINGAEISSVSSRQCVTAISTDTPSPIQEFYSTVNDGRITLLWADENVTKIDEIHLETSTDLSLWTSFVSQKVTDTNFVDNLSSLQTPVTCYRIGYTDICGNKAIQQDGPISCPVFLTLESSELGNQLDWTTFMGSGSPNYTLQWLDDNQEPIESNNQLTNLSFLDAGDNSQFQTTQYRVLIETNGVELYSNVVATNQKTKLWFPTAFSPNDDGNNDEYEVVGQFIEEFEIHIYNRFGELVFESTAIDFNWDGSYQSKAAPPGVYTFDSKYKDDLNKEWIKRGTITLLR